MSTEVTNWTDELAKYAKVDAEKVTPSNSVISLKAGVITYNGQPAPDNKLRAIVIGSASERAYYTDDYDPDNVASPLCWGLGGDGVDAPSELAEEQQSDACATCPMNMWGSATRGKGKACKERVRVALIPAGLRTGEDVLKAEVAIMRVPVTSVKNWANYVILVAHSKRRPTFAVVTEVSTKPDPKSQFVVKFDYVEDVDVEQVPFLIEKRGMAMDVLMKPFEERQEQAPPPAAKGGKHRA